MEKWVRPLALDGYTFKMRSEAGNVYITITHENGEIKEVFIHLGKAGSTVHTLVEALGRTISLALRYGVPLNKLIEQLRGIRTDVGVRQETGEITFSVPDAVAYAFELLSGDDHRKFTREMVNFLLAEKNSP